MPADASKEAPAAIHTQEDTSSQGTTSATGLPVSAPAMELAFDELSHTFEEAEQYRKSGGVHPRHIKLHVDALKEDIAMLSVLETDNDVLRLQAAQLIYSARRLRRTLERDLIDLHSDSEDTSTPPPSVEIPEQNALSKPASIALTPIQMPTFDGDVSQFPIYKTFFEENVLHNAALTDTTKWMRLKESLKNHPAELISELPQSGGALQIAWKLLLDVYGGEDRPIVDLYNKIQNLQPATLQTDRLRVTHSKLEGLLMSLEHLGHNPEANHFIRWTYLGKFPVEVMYQAQKSKDTPLKDLRVAVGEIIAARECTDQQRNSTPQRSIDSSRRSQGSTPQQNQSTPSKSTPSLRKPPSFPRALKCVFCEGEHWNDSCEKYSTLESRKQRLSGRCFKCLRLSHTDTPCISEKRCFHCDSPDHNRALCPSKFGNRKSIGQPQLAVLPVREPQTTGNFLTCIVRAKSTTVTHPIPIRILVDTAGGSTLASEELVTKLQLQKSNEIDEYTGLAGTLLTTGTRLRDDIHLLTEDDAIISVQAAVIQGGIPEGPAADVAAFRERNPTFNDVHIPPTGAGQPIDLLVGSDTMIDILKPDKITAINADTLLLPTKFGSLIVGRQRRHQRKVCHSHLFNFLTNPLQQLSDLDLVGLSGITQSEIDDEEAAIRQFYATVTFQNNRYSISWPWRVYPPMLDSNFGMALGRLRSLHRKLQKTPALLHEYHEIIVKQHREGIIEQINNSVSETNVVHYLPHHPILRPEKSTSLRPVYDGSAKLPKQKSLNENIRKGTKWLNDLIATLLRFRLHKVVVVSDIAKAFHQVAINEEDRDAARFIWLKNPDLPPTDNNLQIYRFTRVAFGIIASPFLLHAVIRYHADQYPDKQFSQLIQQDLYADNLVSSLPDDVDPVEFYSYAKRFFGSMSMNLTKWATNHATLRAFIPEEDQLIEVIQCVLGIRWNLHTDILTLKQPKFVHLSNPTPRIIAREIARWFDPLGWVSPTTLLGKLFFRQMWEEYKNWDVALNPTHETEWNGIVLKLQKIQNVQLPRRYTTFDKHINQELHTFVDASISAYAVVVYLRTFTDSAVQISLVAAKTRLTPKKTVSIPKLELIAILLGCKFTSYIQKTLRLEQVSRTHLWTDSKCALSWMKQNKMLPPILDKYITEAKQFHIHKLSYVPSEQNYADVATRGAEISTLEKLHWWSGPEWLLDKHNWPIDADTNAEIVPMYNFATHVTCKNKIVLESEIQGIATLQIADFSSLTKLLSRTAYCFHALIKFAKSNFLNTQTTIDTALALQWWLYWDQKRCYALPDEPDAGRRFSLHNIPVFRDNTGLIRCQTRIINSVAGLNTKNPILLVQKSTLTKLIILDLHYRNFHAGTSHTLASIRQDYWLPHGRRQIYTVIHNHCLRCKKQLAHPYPNPPAAPLPEFRTTRTNKPFQSIGLDVCGPFYTRTTLGRGQPKNKKWVLLFTCAVIRAIHVEVLNDMTTFETLLAFRRFSARRGVPAMVVSDNAPQFHVLNNCFRDIWHDLASSNELSSYFTQKKIIWKFVPELSPWMGGMYERLVQSIKLALQKTYGDIILLDRQFETTMFEIESIINTRPIAYVDKEPDSPLLCPNDFLMAKYAAIPIQENSTPTDDLLKKLWRSSQTYLNMFWKNWSDHYLMLLRDRNDLLAHKRNTANKHPEKGDIVVMIDLSKKRCSWKMAVVERLIPSHDKQIRAAQIRTGNGIRLIRPIVSLAPIHLQINLPTVHDHQLNIDRTGIILSPPEDATHFEENVNTEDEVDSEEESSQTRTSTE